MRKFYSLYFYGFLLIYSNVYCSADEIKDIKYSLELEQVERTVISYEYQQHVLSDFVNGKVVEYFEPRTANYDLSVYFLNKRNGKTFFQKYSNGIIYYYPDEKGEVSSVYPQQIGMIGSDNDELYLYSYWAPANAFICDEDLGTASNPNNFCSENYITSRSGLPPEYRERLYMIRHSKDKSFVATVTIDEEVNFVWNFLRFSDQGTERTNYPKKYSLPVPQRNEDTLPCCIYELDLYGPFGFSIVNDEDKEIQSKYSSRLLPMDFNDYGIEGELQTDSPFKIQELIDYSDYLDSYAFVGRFNPDGVLPKAEYNDAFWDGEEVLPVKSQNYDEYLFLVDKHGGKPKPILEIEQGHKIEDLLFSPDGKQLVVEIDRDLYVLTFPEEIDPKMIDWAREGIPDPNALDIDLKKFLEEASMEDLRRFRNSFFALMGFSFKSPELVDYFSSYPWYHADSEVIADPEALSDKQKNLLEVIRTYEEKG